MSRTSEYWEKRAEKVAEKGYLEGDELAASLESVYRKIADDLEKEIEVLHAKYGVDGKLSYAEVLKPLTPSEKVSFVRRVNDFIKDGIGKLDFSWIRKLRSLAQQKRVSRLESLLVQARQQVEVVTSAQQLGLTRTLASGYQSAYYQTMFDVQTGSGVATTFARLDVRTINAAVAKGWDGSNYSSRIWSNRDKLINELGQLIPQSFAQGKSVQSTARTLAKKMGAAYRVAERLIRTETANMLQASTFEAYAESGIVQKYKNLATLDKKTSPICRSMDGTVFPLSEQQEGVTSPPFHVNCRTTTVVVFDDFKDPKAERIAKGEDGKRIKVSEDTTYPQWAKLQDVESVSTDSIPPADDRILPPETERVDRAKVEELRARVNAYKASK